MSITKRAAFPQHWRGLHTPTISAAIKFYTLTMDRDIGQRSCSPLVTGPSDPVPDTPCHHTSDPIPDTPHYKRPHTRYSTLQATPYQINTSYIHCISVYLSLLQKAVTRWTHPWSWAASMDAPLHWTGECSWHCSRIWVRQLQWIQTSRVTHHMINFTTIIQSTACTSPVPRPLTGKRDWHTLSHFLFCFFADSACHVNLKIE